MIGFTVNKYFYTRTKNEVQTEKGVELFLFASLVKEMNQELGGSTRQQVKPIVSKMIEEPIVISKPIFKELPNDTVMYEVSFSTFKHLESLAENDIESFFLYEKER